MNGSNVVGPHSLPATASAAAAAAIVRVAGLRPFPADKCYFALSYSSKSESKTVSLTGRVVALSSV